MDVKHFIENKNCILPVERVMDEKGWINVSGVLYQVPLIAWSINCIGLFVWFSISTFNTFCTTSDWFWGELPIRVGGFITVGWFTIGCMEEEVTFELLTTPCARFQHFLKTETQSSCSLFCHLEISKIISNKSNVYLRNSLKIVSSCFCHQRKSILSIFRKIIFFNWDNIRQIDLSF